MSICSPGVSLPAAVTGPTAWAAFRLVFSSPSWTITLAQDGTDEVDLVSGPEFQGWLDEVSSRWYDAAARGFVSSQILEVCGTLTPTRVRQLRLVGDRDQLATSERLRSYVKEQVRERLNGRFLIGAWEQQVRIRSRDLPEAARIELHRFLGLDLIVDAKVCAKGLNYLFRTIKPEIRRIDEHVAFTKTWRIDSVARKERSGDPADLGRALALRAGEALLHRLAEDADREHAPTVEELEARFRALTEEHGAWAMVAQVIAGDRTQHGRKVPNLDDPALTELIDQQPVLLAQIIDGLAQKKGASDPEPDLLLSDQPCGAAQ